MTTKLVGIALLATLIALAPLAAAEAESGPTDPERPDDAAWVEDCPPDMMCAFSHSNDTADDNLTFGPDGCIDCMTPMPVDDNTTWGTDCPDGVYCMYDGSPEPADPATDDVETDTGEAASPAFMAVVIGVGAMALVAGLRKD